MIMYQLFGDQVIDKMTKNVAKVHKLFPRKGIIAEGSDADMFVFHLSPKIINKTHGFADYNLYKGIEVKGEIRTTISNGQFVVKEGKFFNRKGNLLNEGGA
jgi:dihydropyrimidinase